MRSSAGHRARGASHASRGPGRWGVTSALNGRTHTRIFRPRNTMKHSRDLFDVQNVGEFAFAMCAMGFVLAIIAFVAAFFLSLWIGIGNSSLLIALTVAFWVPLNVPVYRSLRQKAKSWVGERRGTNQVVYVEICSMAMLAGLSLLAEETMGARELIVFLRYLFSFWILSLLLYQVFIHLALQYRICTRDAVRWCVIGGTTIYGLYAAIS